MPKQDSVIKPADKVLETHGLKISEQYEHPPYPWLTETGYHDCFHACSRGKTQDWHLSTSIL